jgi:hypothetical protein
MKKAELLKIMDEKIHNEEKEIEQTLNFNRKKNGSLKKEGYRILDFRSRTVSMMQTMRALVTRLDD